MARWFIHKTYDSSDAQCDGVLQQWDGETETLKSVSKGISTGGLCHSSRGRNVNALLKTGDTQHIKSKKVVEIVITGQHPFP